MQISLNWLQDFVQFPGTVEALADVLTLSGTEVEKIHRRGVELPKVVVAQILSSEQHPNADRLSVCQVDDGTGTPRQIVCGAKNYRVGDKVPLALPGAALPGDFKIKAGKLRGVESNGMLCSAKELALAEDAAGLLILPPESPVGAPISELFPPDTVLDLEVTPNRPDLLSHRGVAREISAVAGLELQGSMSQKAELDLSHPVEVQAEECPFYTARLVEGVQAAPSPAWLRQRLESVGVRSISNLVDITNYVMLERGQPLHVFDADKLQGDLRVRAAIAGETFAALDGRTYTLQPHHLVIADAQGAVAIAGVMGGEASGVSATTTRVWLESAYFSASSVRRTGRELGLFSESSHRFEREVDPAGVLVASQRATELLRELAGGRPGELRIGFGANAQFGFDATAAREGVEFTGLVPLRLSEAERVLGIELTEAQVEDILSGFCLRHTPQGWEIPSFRPDLTREIDLIEELARVIGLDELPASQVARFTETSAADHQYDRALEFRRRLAGLGLHETRTLSLISEKALRHVFAPIVAARIRNPLGEDTALLRPSLLPGLLDGVGRNTRAGERSIRLFEAGRVFSAAAPEERVVAAVALSGASAAPSWRTRVPAEWDLYALKGLLSAALGEEVGMELEPHPGLALRAALWASGQCIGFAGQLWPAEARALDATAPVLVAEVDLTAWLAEHAASARFREIPRFPAVGRDIAFLAQAELSHAAISAAFLTAAEPLLAEAELFDVFSDPTGQKVPAGKKSLAYALTYRAPERTLTAEEVNAAHTRLKAHLKSALAVQFRE